MKFALIASYLAVAVAIQPVKVDAASLSVSIKDQQQQPLIDAVAELRADSMPSKEPKKFQVAQQQLTFVPFVSAIPAGSMVEFPNLDKTRHHIYSFSAAKQFEIQLYAGKPEAPISFNKPGIVALGCNIHDYMQAYIYVSQSNLVGVTDSEGKVTFADVPAGSYQLYLWHPWQLQAEPPVTLELDNNDRQAAFNLAVDLTQQKPKPPQRGFGSR